MITDWDDAYANGIYVDGADDIAAAWEVDAAVFRDRMTTVNRAELNMPYGQHPREVMDIFHPEGTPKGLVVFVHGGYWISRDKNLWSHMAAGAVARGWAVALPGYTLCPEVRIADITRQIATAVDFAAARFNGPIHLTGHSAGGHLAARMGCVDVDLACASRIKRILPISGVHDLRPMLHTEMNADFRMDMAGAIAESPALLTPRTGFDLTCWVGADERPEFVRQNALLANVWTGFGMNITCVEEPALNHFTVVNSLVKPESALTQALVG
ncbi:MAG: alpha/beta hydrolase [Rhodobacteraceae bacterium]|nr:alpha/beta hydrolase [Paracoccaceae bacterium]